MRIIGISGRAGSGKDAIADVLVARHGFVKVALADEIKRCAQRWWGFSDEQLWGPSDKRNAPDWRYPLEVCHGCQTCEFRCDHPISALTPRRALQHLGTEVARGIYPDTWIDLVIKTARWLEQDGGFYDQRRGPVSTTRIAGDWMRAKTAVVVPDVRFSNELAKLVGVGGRVVRVVRPGAGLVGGAGAHASETELADDSKGYHAVLVNDGTLEDLQALASRLVESESARPLGEVRDRR